MVGFFGLSKPAKAMAIQNSGNNFLSLDLLFNNKSTLSMEKTRVLFVSQEIFPFVPESETALLTRKLIQSIQEKGKEIRVFQPKYGKINERRHQLHEVIRLSGMNMVVNGADYPLIIKVASVPGARMQVYFIDNDVFFKRKAYLTDDNQTFFKDSDERAIFFAKGVLETVKKLGWAPDIIHCHGWMSAVLPAYLKTSYRQDPHFLDTKVVYTPYSTEDGALPANKTGDKLKSDGVDSAHLGILDKFSHEKLDKFACNFADGIMLTSETGHAELAIEAGKLDIPVVRATEMENFPNEADALYDAIMLGKTVMAE